MTEDPTPPPEETELTETGHRSDETRAPTWLDAADADAAPRPDREAGPADVPSPPNDQEGPEEEPPHLERGSPHDDEPAPYEPPAPEIP